MGREVKRIAVGFDWPLKKVWGGYLGWFDPPECGACERSGYSPEAKAFREALPYSDDRDRLVAERFPGESYRCKWCGGHGHIRPTDPAVLAALAPWKDADSEYYRFPKQEPPAGDGWQLWETTSDGSPITPVFASAEDLATYCAAHQFDDERRYSISERWNALAGGTCALSYDQWLAFIRRGWAPSMVVDAGGLRSGVEFVAESATPSED
jgi:hypothetical protein